MEDFGLKYFKEPKAFMEYPNDAKKVCKSIRKYNEGKVRKVLIVFDDMIADMISDKKLYPIVTELLIRRRKSNIPLISITQPYFTVPKHARLETTHFYIMNIPNKRKLQKIATNCLSDIDFD